jgi:predicted ATPase
MDFYAMVEQVPILLRSRGRVPYRALKQQLQVDDDAIEALKDELNYAQHVAVDEERWWEAEIYRLRGVVFLRQRGTPSAEAEGWLQRALDVARRQETKSLELRAAMSLARL